MRRCVTLAILCLAAAGCLAPAPPPWPVYDWSPSGPIARAATSQCRRILLVGDSVMNQTAPQLAPLYAQYGYCVSIDNEAVGGSGPATLTGWGTWTNRLRALLARARPDLIVSFFQGNGGDTLLGANAQESLNMIDLAAQYHVPIDWTYPMLTAWDCAWDNAVNYNGYEAYRQWVFTSLPRLRPGVLRVNANVLTPAASPTQRGPATYNDSLRFAGMTHDVRAGDCTHIQNYGPFVVAYEIVYATQALWGTVQGTATIPAQPRPLAPNLPVPSSESPTKAA